MAWVGGLLLLITLLGEFTSLGNYGDTPPKQWDTFDTALASRTPTFDSILTAARQRAGDNAGDNARMNALYDVVTMRFTHGTASHNLFSNWILWLKGLVRPQPANIKSSRILVGKGHSGLCGQVAQLLADLARSDGIRAHVVQLNGHVVMEAFYDGAWHLYDVDSEVPAPRSDIAPKSVDELIAAPGLLSQMYRDHNPKIPPLILSTEDNYIGDQDAAKTRFEHLTERAEVHHTRGIPSRQGYS